MDSQPSLQAEEAYDRYHQWIEQQEGVRGCSLGIDIDQNDREVIRVIVDPSRHEELSKTIRGKVGDCVKIIPTQPRAL